MSDEYIKKLDCGEFAYCADAFVFDGTTPRDGQLALLCKDLQAYGARGEATSIAQFYGLVLPGLILARHVFVGLRRPLLTDGDKDADKAMLVYTRKPAYDYVWVGGPHDGHIEQMAVPAGKVFVVIARPNHTKHTETYPDIDGWINAWCWVDEDAMLGEAPTDWVDRYDDKLWSREE